MRIPKRLGVVTLVQAQPCWVQWDQLSALLCIQLCLKLQSSTKSCGNLQGSDRHLLSSLSQEKCDSQMGEQQRAWSEDAVSAPKFPSSCSSHCNHSSVPMGALRKYQPLSVEVERTEKPPALTQHCHHPQKRWRCTQATQTPINLQINSNKAFRPQQRHPLPSLICHPANLPEQSGFCQGDFGLRGVTPTWPFLTTEMHFGLLGFTAERRQSCSHLQKSTVRI